MLKFTHYKCNIIVQYNNISYILQSKLYMPVLILHTKWTRKTWWPTEGDWRQTMIAKILQADGGLALDSGVVRRGSSNRLALKVIVEPTTVQLFVYNCHSTVAVYLMDSV